MTYLKTRNGILMTVILALVLGSFLAYIVYSTTIVPHNYIQSAPSAPDTLVVTREANTEPPISAINTTITDRAVVAKIYADINALPDLPKGNYNCPDMGFASYHLVFYEASKVVIETDYSPTGCKTLTIRGVAKRSLDGLFDTDLQESLGLTRDDYYGALN